MYVIELSEVEGHFYKIWNLMLNAMEGYEK
jgi:hypothetical protein